MARFRSSPEHHTHRSAWARTWLGFAVISALLGMTSGRAGAAEIPLTALHSRVRLRQLSPTTKRITAGWTMEPALNPPALVMPVCPTASILQITSDTGTSGPVPLSCTSWRSEAGGYALDQVDASSGYAEHVVIQPGKLKISLRGTGTLPMHGPLSFVEISLTIGNTRYCGRFQAPTTTFLANRTNDIAAVGPSLPCAPPPPLNVIVINLDDSRFDGLDRMPVLNSRLLPESRLFTNSFVPLSSCCSSRASLFTGLYAVHHQVRQVAGPIGGAKVFRESGFDQRTIAVWLQQAGYATGLFGKYLNEYNLENDKGPGGTYYIPPGWTRWRAFAGEHYGGVHGSDYELVKEDGEVVSYTDHSSDIQYSTDVTAAEMRQFIADSVAAAQPFFAVWTPYASHGDTPGLAPIPADVYLNTLENIPLFRPPSWNEADISDKPLWMQGYATDAVTVAVTDEMRKRAYETLLSVDDELKLILDDLDSLGIANKTLLVLTSDNGVTWGEHRLWAQGKGCAYEECLRVPLMVRLPGTIPPGIAPSPALNIDIAPTVADLVGIPVPTVVDGRTLRPALMGTTQFLRDDFLLEQWRLSRNASLTYTGQPADGDRLRVYYGSSFPRQSMTFEFDNGNGVAPNNVAVPIQSTADATYAILGHAITTHVPFASGVVYPGHRFVVLDLTPDFTGFFMAEDTNQSQSFQVELVEPDFFGVRDVRDRYTYVQFEDGEVELYDLATDPWQLQNVAGSPAYADVQASLAARTRQLAGLP